MQSYTLEYEKPLRLAATEARTIGSAHIGTEAQPVFGVPAPDLLAFLKRAKRVFDTVSPSHASPFHYLHISPAGELVVSDNYRLLRARIDSGAFADDSPLTLVLHRVIVNDMIALLRGAKKGTVTFARSAEAVVVSGSDKAGAPWRIVAERNQAYRYLDVSSFDRGFEPVALHVPVEQFLSSARSAALANEPKNPYITLRFSAAKKLITMASDSGVGTVGMLANVLRTTGGRVNHTFFDVLDGIAEIDIFIRPTAHACFQCVGVAGALKLKYLVMTATPPAHASGTQADKAEKEQQ